jgi:hypothetical protein
MAAVAAATEAEADEEEVSLCVIMTNTEIFHIFHLFSLFNLHIMKISHINVNIYDKTATSQQNSD